MTATKSYLFKDVLKTPGYLSQFNVARIRLGAQENSDADFQEFFGCTKENALKILGYWEVAQIELWDIDILQKFFHVWIFEDRQLVVKKIQAAQIAGRLAEWVTPEAGLQWLEFEGVQMGMIPQWVRCNVRRRGAIDMKPFKDAMKHTAGTKGRRGNWKDMVLPHLIETCKTGRHTTAKALYSALERNAGAENSPFQRGLGAQSDKLIHKNTGTAFGLKTFENHVMPKVKAGL